MGSSFARPTTTTDAGARPALPAALRLRSLSAFIPVHDEEANLLPMVDALLPVLPRVADRWELVIVDDGSRDGTRALAAELARSRPGVRAVHHPSRRGYGAAIRSGLGAARFEYIFYTDGDRQFDPTQVTQLVAGLDRADVVVGYRRRRADRLVRRLGTFVWNALVRALFRVDVRDVNCAFKLIPRAALVGVELASTGAAISTELLVRLRERGQRISEVPVDHWPRAAGTASGGSPRVVARALVELARLRRALRAR
jgi:glycosyltransferase involved in cell wall biosynthesis